MNIYECEEKNKIIFPQSFKDILNKAEAQWLDEPLEWIFDNEDKLREQIAFGFPSIGDFKLLSDVYVELLETLSKEELEQYVCNIQLPECPEFIV